MADTKIPSSNQQAQDAQHLDNMTSLQQPSAAEQSPISHTTDARGDAPVTSSPAPAQDSPSLFNEPKNPNNKVVEVESSENADEVRPEASDSQSRNIVGAEGLSPANAVNTNANFVIQGNVAVGETLAAAADSASPNAAQAVSNAERSTPTPIGRVPAGTISPASQSSTSAPPTSPSNTSTSSTDGAAAGAVSSPPSPTTQPTFNTLVTPIPVTSEDSVSATPVNSAPAITSGASATFAENATGTVYTATASDVDAGTTLTYSLGGADAAL
ncbi:MAG: hypothetical protein WA115_05555, partial [Polynucleobacter sp.]